MSVVGFDIGNAYSKIAVTKNKNIQMVPNDLSKLATPTLVTYSNKDRHFGEQSLSTWARTPRTTISGIKRLLGRKYNDPKLKDEAKDYIFYPLESLDANDHIGIKVPTSHNLENNEDKILAPEQILGSYLAKLKEFTHKFMDNMPIKDCVIACPAYFDDAQRRALLTAAKLAELNVLRLINETTAIALQYGILRPLPQDSTRRVIFVDIGDSDTQVAVVDFVHGQLTVKKTSFIDCGGRDFDLSLYKYLVNKFETQHKHIDLNDYPRARLRLLREASNIKKLLSGNRDAVVTLDCLVDELDIQLHVTREEFEKFNEENLKKIVIPLQQILDIIKNDNVIVHSIEIVGGVSRIPSIQESILNVISKYDSNINKLMTTLNGDEACARGAALMCAMLSPNFKVREFQVKDINTWPISLSYINEKQENTIDIVLKPGDPQPCTAKVTFLKQSSFDFSLEYPTDAKIDENTTLHVDYPILSNRKIGEFRCQIPELSLNLVNEPKIKLSLNLNKHSLIEWPEAMLIEYVKKEEKKEVKKPPEATNNNEENKDQDKNKENGPEPMEVDSKEEQPQAQQQQASSSEQALPEQTSSNNNNKMETEDGNEGSDSKDGKSDKKTST
jgi:heat shock protein 4